MAILNEQDIPQITVTDDGAVRVFTLNRPARMNALTLDMLHKLGELIHAANADPSVRVLVFTGAGERAFCAGADVAGLQSAAATSVEQQLREPMPVFTPRQCQVYKPSICAVNGICAGAGLHFVADCDIVIAADNASFVDSHVNVGQVTALEPIGLARRIPLGTVLRMVILGKAEKLDAQRALQCGLVSEVVSPAQLIPRAMELARVAAEVSPAAVRASLQAIWQSFEMPLAQAYAQGYEALVRHRSHPDASEGPRAFIEKRVPIWANK